MKKLHALFFCCLGLAVFISACREGLPSGAAFPEVSFGQTVMPIFASNCTASGCHGSEDTEDFTLLSFDDVVKNGEVSPGDPGGSKLYKIITSPIEGKVMPPPPNHPLTDEQTAQVYLWILQGAKNN